MNPGKEAKIAKCEAEEAAISETKDLVWRSLFTEIRIINTYFMEIYMDIKTQITDYP